MIGDIFEFEDLKKLTGGSSPADVVSRLRQMQIQFQRYGERGKPFTTLQAINDSMGVDGRKQPEQALNDPVISIK